MSFPLRTPVTDIFTLPRLITRQYHLLCHRPCRDMVAMEDRTLIAMVWRMKVDDLPMDKMVVFPTMWAPPVMFVGL